MSPFVGPLSNIAETDQVIVELPDLPGKETTWGTAGMPVSTWKSYEFHRDFMTPVASWKFEVADEHLETLQTVVQNGQRISLRVNGKIQATGYVDQIQINSSRSGSTMTISGRDALAQAADSYVDPHFHFPESTNLKDFLLKLFSPFQFATIAIADDLNRQKVSGTTRFLLTDSERNFIDKVLTNPINKKFKPHPAEGVYEFAERIGKRFGFHIWCGADAKTLFIGRPTFKQPPIYKLIHHREGNTSSNNILDSNVTWDWSKQPSLIIAEGAGGGGQFKKHIIKAMMVNELLTDSASHPIVKQIQKDFPEAALIPRRTYLQRPERIKEVTKFARPVYLYDDESKTQEQLQNYVRRIMAEYQSNFLSATYTVPGHSQDGVVWTPNTIVTVDDEVSGIKQELWIKGVTFTKDRGGTKTRLDCILPYTLELSPQG